MVKPLSIDGKMLAFNIKLMDWLNMWPDENKVEKKILRSFKDISSLFNLFVMTIAISSDFVIQVKGNYDEIMDINENLTALGALFVSIYMGVCFMKQRREIMALVKKLNIFEEFNAQEDMLETERKAALLSKIFVSYGVIGNLSYLAMPYTNMADCRERRAASIYSQDMSCNLITRFRLPFRYQDSWMLYVVVIWQLVACLHTTYVTLAVTMFLISLLMHVIIQMKRLRIMLKNGDNFQKCQRYHDMIIE